MKPIHTEHPAYIATVNAIRHVTNKDKDAWLDLFAEDAVSHNPLGPSPLDLEGKGFHGREGHCLFWDILMASGGVHVDILQAHPCGDSCATLQHVTRNYDNGKKVEVDIIVVYRVNQEGKIVSRIGYWEFEEIMKQLNT